MSEGVSRPGWMANAALASIMVDFRPKLNRALRDAYVDEGPILDAVPDRAKVEAVLSASKNILVIAESSLDYLKQHESEDRS